MRYYQFYLCLALVQMLTAWYLLAVFGCAGRVRSVAFATVTIILCMHSYDFWTIWHVIRSGMLPEAQRMITDVFWFGVRNLASAWFWFRVSLHSKRMVKCLN